MIRLAAFAKAMELRYKESPIFIIAQIRKEVWSMNIESTSVIGSNPVWMGMIHGD
jgi:hypothetical protein